MQYYISNIWNETMLWNNTLLVFDTLESAYRFAEEAKRIYGFRASNYVVMETRHLPHAYSHIVNATNLLPFMDADKRESLVEA